MQLFQSPQGVKVVSPLEVGLPLLRAGSLLRNSNTPTVRVRVSLTDVTLRIPTSAIPNILATEPTHPADGALKDILSRNIVK